MNHLDVGYTNLWSSSVLRELNSVSPGSYPEDCYSVMGGGHAWTAPVCGREAYVQYHFPQAMATAQEYRRRGGKDKYVFTTFPWLVADLLEHSGNETFNDELEAAIRRGDVTWTANPLNSEPENAVGADLFVAGLEQARDLDKRFGRTAHSAVAHEGDLPGISIATVPLLADAGVRMVHVGANGAVNVPDLPPLFRWRKDGKEVLAHVGNGYGSTIAPPYTEETCDEHCIEQSRWGVRNVAPGFTEVLEIDVRQERGPLHTPTDVDRVYADARKAYPGAEVVLSSWDEFLAAAEPFRESLPVIEGEIGDSWNWGMASDPFKQAAGREAERARQEWLDAGRVSMDDSGFRSFTLQLQKVSEHTFGVFQGYVNTSVFPDSVTYTKDGMTAARREKGSGVKYVEASWEDQRQFLRNATSALGKTQPTLAAELTQRIEDLRPNGPPALTGDVAGPFAPDDVHEKLFTHGQAKLSFNSTTGAMSLLQCSGSGPLADAQHPLGLVRYQTFTMDDFNAWAADYMKKGKCIRNFCKEGMEDSGAESRLWQTRLIQLWQSADSYLLHLGWESNEPAEKYGAPAELWVNVTVTGDCPALTVSFDVDWRNKTASRLPEGMWVTFAPAVNGNSSDWRMGKLGTTVSPFNVVKGGEAKLHGLSDAGAWHPNACGGIGCAGAAVRVQSLDAGLTAPGGTEPDGLLRYKDDKPALSPDTPGGGWHFNLQNNLWNTNYPLWYPFLPEDESRSQRFRFRVALEPSDLII